MQAKIVLLPGDGIGPEVVAESARLLEMVAEVYGHTFEFDSHMMGGCAIDEIGVPLSDDTLEACRQADAILLGAVGGPKWSDPQAAVRPEQGLLKLRYELGLFANLRPVTVRPALIDASPLRPELLEGVDILMVRELTGGIYFGEPRKTEEVNGELRAVDSLVYSESEIRRVVRLAFELAGNRKKRVMSVDKANILDTSRLWRRTADEVAKDFPGIELEHQLVDSAAMRLITSPKDFDVVVTENMFGDILSDEASVLAGSLGMLPSASLGETSQGLYEPIHGSAPDIAGEGIANPLGTILSAAMLLRHSLGLEDEASAVEKAVDQALEAGARTIDLGGKYSTRQMGASITDQMASSVN
jgi:3-isopropylmalate dehydrogenase